MTDSNSRATHFVPTCSHWGNYRVETDGEKLLSVQSYEVDKEPTPIGQSLLDALDEGARIPRPMVRAGYLEKGRYSDGAGRGREPFVPVSWDVALELAARVDQGRTLCCSQRCHAGAAGNAGAGSHAGGYGCGYRDS